MAGRIRVGIVGCGNCAWSLAQGLAFYANETTQTPPGLMNVVLGGYRIADIEIASAFDVHAGKVGRDVAEALTVAPNNTCVFAEVPATGVTVSRGPTMDGIGQWLKPEIPESPEPAADVARVLRDTGTQILINYLPVGSEAASRFYIEEALKAGCAVINCIPVFIASDPHWAARFKAAGLPIIGDDIKSQVGATIVHRALAQLLRSRGVHLERTYQLNFGGNADFLNMLERERLQSKKISKTQAVASLVGHRMADRDIHVGPSDHVPWLDDRKWAQIRLEGTGFGGTPINIELKLEVWDSPNSAGVVIDAIRCARIGLDRRIGGPLVGPSSYFMKSPPVQFDDHEAHARTAAFAEGERDAAE